MKNERKGQDKNKMLTEAKQNAELAEFISSITKEEIQRIKDTREFNEIKPGTPTYKVALMCDSLRQQKRGIEAGIRKRLWVMGDTFNKIQRLKQQSVSGVITEKLPNGKEMNMQELEADIQHMTWLIDGEFNALFPMLGQLRSIVQHKDVAGNIIMTMDQYDSFITEIAGIVKKYGYDLFKEVEQ